MPCFNSSSSIAGQDLREESANSSLNNRVILEINKQAAQKKQNTFSVCFPEWNISLLSITKNLKKPEILSYSFLVPVLS
jgi:hypothetical protein